MEDHNFSQSMEKIEHLIALQKYDMAENRIREMLTFYPESSTLHCYLARVSLAKNDLNTAKEACTTALQLEPTSFSAKIYLGNIYMKRHEHRKAEQVFIEILRLFPQEASLYYIYATLMYKTGYLEKAKDLLEYSLKLNPEYEDAHSLLASVLAEKKSFFSSIKHGQKSVQLSPNDDSSHYHLGISLLLAGRPFRARYHLREALRIDPDDSDVEKAFLEADRCTRWTALPAYYLSWICQKIPGQHFGLWIIFVISIYTCYLLKVPDMYVFIFVASYVLLAIYSWIAYPLTKLWIKLRPPR